LILSGVHPKQSPYVITRLVHYFTGACKALLLPMTYSWRCILRRATSPDTI